VAGSCNHGDEPSGSGATELVSSVTKSNLTQCRPGLKTKVVSLRTSK
jgi:hypothetical protein